MNQKICATFGGIDRAPASTFDQVSVATLCRWFVAILLVGCSSGSGQAITNGPTKSCARTQCDVEYEQCPKPRSLCDQCWDTCGAIDLDLALDCADTCTNICSRVSVETSPCAMELERCRSTSKDMVCLEDVDEAQGSGAAGGRGGSSASGVSGAVASGGSGSSANGASGGTAGSSANGASGGRGGFGSGSSASGASGGVGGSSANGASGGVAGFGSGSSANGASGGRGGFGSG